MTEKRIVRRTALTQKQIHKLTPEELAHYLSPEEKQMVLQGTKMGFDTKPPKKRADESSGEYSRRCREAKKVDKQEFARALRLNAEAAVFNSAGQKGKRVIDGMTSGITRESAAKREEEKATRDRESRAHDIMSGDISMPGVTRWEE